MSRLLGISVFCLLLAGCGNVRRSAIEVELTGDLARGTATMTCRASTSGICHAMFLTGGETKTLDAATGAIAIADRLAAGTRFCVAPSAPDPATCRASDLTGGRQIVRHERRETD